jgi:hypothetical protein
MNDFYSFNISGWDGSNILPVVHLIGGIAEDRLMDSWIR